MTMKNDNTQPLHEQGISECLQPDRFDPQKSEIDFLHSLDFCPDAIGSLRVEKNTRFRLRELIVHWRERGRPHPVLIRGKNWGYDNDSLLHELVDFSISYLKNVKVSHDA